MTVINQKSAVYHDVPCPFCSLLCDDLIVANQDGKLKVTHHGCHIAAKGFELEQSGLKPAIKGKACSLDEAVKEAIRILKKSRQPLITGLGTDVNGVRAALALAEKTGAIIDHMHSAAAFRNLKVLQDHGWVTTTMAEIKNRADLVIFAGTDAMTNYPRFFERVIWNENSLARNNNKQRQLVYIGDALDISPARKRGSKTPINISCKQDHISEIITTLHALTVGNTLPQSAPGGIKLSDLENLAVMMKQARYGVIVWAPGELDITHAELPVHAICELIKYLNRTTRFAGFSLGGSDGGMTASNVCAWQSGYPSRISYNKGYPEYEPHRYSAQNILKARETDALLWISSFSTTSKPPRARIPTIVMSSQLSNMDITPEVFIPVGIPGVHHKGQLMRTDSVVSLNLKQVAEGQYPGTAEILKRVLNAL